MGKLELEVKVLDIEEKEIINKIESLGGKLLEESIQHSYMYDLPTIYGRYIECLMQINYPESSIKFEVDIERMRSILKEIDNNLESKEKQELLNKLKIKDIKEIIDNKNYKEILNKEEFIKLVRNMKINYNKWIRLRKTNDVIELTVKQLIHTERKEKLQKIIENEIKVDSFEEANKLLEELGFFHKSYLEKKRKTYELKGYKIEIDSWPMIPTYMEIEGKNESDLENILNILGYKLEDSISCTAGDVYQIYGYNDQEFRELKFS